MISCKAVISGREINQRLAKVRERMRADGVSAFYASKPEDVLYLTGRDSGRVVVTENEAFLWVRDIYSRLYGSHYSKLPYDVFGVEGDSLKKFFGRRRFRRVGVGGVSYSSVRGLRKVVGGKITVSDAVERARSVKTQYEIGHLAEAARIASAGMRKAESIIRSGRTELSFAAEVECFIRKMGSESPPFYDGLLLASGPESADVHAHPSRRVVGRGIVLVDLGAKYFGYYSDMTRTFCVGRPTKHEREMVEFVENLRDECVDMVLPGVKASEVYDYASGEIAQKRLRFYHSLGHGVGLEVHESPNLGPKSNDVLAENMVFTIEPGIYLPRKFGVRFEDTVVLTKNGARKITKR